MLDCPASLMEYLDLFYDPSDKSFKSMRGVTAGGDVGDLRSIKIVTEPPMCAGGQFDQFVKYLVAIGGYTELKDLFGVPYDWRLILDPTYWAALSLALRELIEKHTGGCSNTRASLIGFSLGSFVIIRFLREQTLEWRQKFIQRVIFVGAPLGGCPKAFISVCGTMEDLPGYNTPCVRRFLQRCSGAFMCHPIPAAFPGLVIIKDLPDPETGCTQSFTVEQLREAYQHPRFNTKSACDIYRDYADFINNFTSAGIADDVEVHIVYSSVKDTTVGLDYKKTDTGIKIRESDYYRSRLRRGKKQVKSECCPDLEPREGARWIVGDGIVPHLSLAFWDSKSYPNGKPYTSSIKCFFGGQYEHADMFNRIDIIQYVYGLLDVSCLDHELEPLVTSGSRGT